MSAGSSGGAHLVTITVQLPMINRLSAHLRSVHFPSTKTIYMYIYEFYILIDDKVTYPFFCILKLWTGHHLVLIIYSFSRYLTLCQLICNFHMYFYLVYNYFRWYFYLLNSSQMKVIYAIEGSTRLDNFNPLYRLYLEVID